MYEHPTPHLAVQDETPSFCMYMSSFKEPVIHLLTVIESPLCAGHWIGQCGRRSGKDRPSLNWGGGKVRYQIMDCTVNFPCNDCFFKTSS